MVEDIEAASQDIRARFLEHARWEDGSDLSVAGWGFQLCGDVNPSTLGLGLWNAPPGYRPGYPGLPPGDLSRNYRQAIRDLNNMLKNAHETLLQDPSLAEAAHIMDCGESVAWAAVSAGIETEPVYQGLKALVIGGRAALYAVGTGLAMAGVAGEDNVIGYAGSAVVLGAKAGALAAGVGHEYAHNFPRTALFSGMDAETVGQFLWGLVPGVGAGRAIHHAWDACLP